MAMSDEMKAKYKPTIGIETHVQLKTKTKLFSGVGNDARQAEPNTLISHIDIALPGALPVLNEKAVELATRTAFALNTKPRKHSYFERKHYFYPDSPAGYQISQLHAPIVVGGSVEIAVEEQKKSVKVNRIQLEADAGKNIHPGGADYTLVDLNRAGTPLLEIVSEPEISSPQEAKAFARELYLLMKYADVSDVDLYHGNMRFDVNVSVSQNDKKGIRTEIKNLNSFRSVEGAVAYEIDRQIEVLEKGGEVIQETRGWDEAKQRTTAQRGKEEAHDYRYFPDPDIPPIELSDEFIDEVKQNLPMLPLEYRQQFSAIGLDTKLTETLLDIAGFAPWISRLAGKHGAAHAKRVAFWLISLPADEARPAKGTDEMAVKLSQMVADGKLNSTAAKEIFMEVYLNNVDPEVVAKEKNLTQVSDESQIEDIVKKVLSQNPKAAEDLKNGEARAIGFLVGQVMAASGGKANPLVAQAIIKKQLGIQ